MRRSGFTLIEVLIAMSIFAVVSVITFQGIRSSMTVQERTQEHAEDLAEIQLVWTVLFQDFANMARRPIREEGRDKLYPAFDLEPDDDSECVVSFTRAGLPLSVTLPMGMQRLAYCLREGGLYRASWPVLDRTRDTLPQESLLMEGVENFIVETYPQDFDPEEEKDVQDDDVSASDTEEEVDTKATGDLSSSDSDARAAINKMYELPVGVVITIETSDEEMVRWFPGGEEYQLDPEVDES